MHVFLICSAQDFKVMYLENKTKADLLTAGDGHEPTNLDGWISVWSLHILLISTWVLFAYSGLLSYWF